MLPAEQGCKSQAQSPAAGPTLANRFRSLLAASCPPHLTLVSRPQTRCSAARRSPGARPLSGSGFAVTEAEEVSAKLPPPSPHTHFLDEWPCFQAPLQELRAFRPGSAKRRHPLPPKGPGRHFCYLDWDSQNPLPSKGDVHLCAEAWHRAWALLKSCLGSLCQPQYH